MHGRAEYALFYLVYVCYHHTQFYKDVLDLGDMAKLGKMQMHVCNIMHAIAYLSSRVKVSQQQPLMLIDVGC